MLNGLSPEMVLRQRLEADPALANPTYKPPSSSLIKQTLRIVEDAKEVSHPDIDPVAQHRASLQKRFHRAEHWVVMRGTADVTIYERVVLVHEIEAVYLPIGSMHRLTNLGKIPLELAEVQVGSYTGEDVVMRIEDIYYGR
ncbi:mannose-1-phosphate guanylyltransferase [Methylobacterium sp. ME121]|nr:mannose-1-phosphate guanylyltransferase [Methylobacterium sp. ME121]